jgi:hypothetical protein
LTAGASPELPRARLVVEDSVEPFYGNPDSAKGFGLAGQCEHSVRELVMIALRLSSPAI